MFSPAHNISAFVKPCSRRSVIKLLLPLHFAAPIRSFSGSFPADPHLDAAILKDQKWILCAKLLKELADEPIKGVPLHELEKRRQRLRLWTHVSTFLDRNRGPFEVYTRPLKRKPVPFVRISDRFRSLLEEEKMIHRENESVTVVKLCKLLLMAKGRAVRAAKLSLAKKEFGLPDDFLFDLVPRYPQYFRTVGSPGSKKWSLELVSWDPAFEKSVIEFRAEEEERLTGIRVPPSFNPKPPPGGEWMRNWTEAPYTSPYEEAWDVEAESMAMEKRTVGIFHELLSLTVLKAIRLPVLASFFREYGFSKAFINTFRRHSGIFYVSEKSRTKVALLKEAYDGGQLVDRDPLLEIRDKFMELLEEGRRRSEPAAAVSGVGL